MTVQLTKEQSILLGVTPPPEGSIPLEETKVKRIKSKASRLYRRPLELTEAQSKLVKKRMDEVYREWDQNTGSLRSRLREINELIEGRRAGKSFPWENSSNLHIPIIEIHMSILHSVASSTMLENDPVFFVKILQDRVGENVENDVEVFLNSVCKTQMKIDVTLSDIYWNTYRDGTGIGDLDWVEEYGFQQDIQYFDSVESFQLAFPDPQSAGLTEKAYQEHIQAILEEGSIAVRIEDYMCTYRGPKLRTVDLKDFVVVPVTSPTLEYALFVGDVFTQRGDYYRRKVKSKWFNYEETAEMLKSGESGSETDEITSSQNKIEGLSNTRVTTPDEYLCLQGILSINLSEDEMEPERMYLVVFCPKTRNLLRIEPYPYLHGRLKYIIWRFKRRVGRLLGQSIYDMLWDINEEIDTQHNQRIDSRTITTVPSFLKVDGFEFDPTRKDQKFYPGVQFKVSNFNQIKQFDIKQTDLGQSLQEEQNLMYLAELRTGATALRGGKDVSKDPRASGKKIQLQLSSSDVRIDDHMRELRIGTAELGSQILELYYQYAPDIIPFMKQDPETRMFVATQVARQKLRSKGMQIEVARTSIAENPSQLVQRALTVYQLFEKEPLIGGNMTRRRELIQRVLTAMRERNIDKLLPTEKQFLEELAAQDQKLNTPTASPSQQALGQNLQGKAGKKDREAKGSGDAPSRALDTSNGTPPVQG